MQTGKRGPLGQGPDSRKSDLAINRHSADASIPLLLNGLLNDRNPKQRRTSPTGLVWLLRHPGSTCQTAMGAIGACLGRRPTRDERAGRQRCVRACKPPFSPSMQSWREGGGPCLAPGSCMTAGCCQPEQQHHNFLVLLPSGGQAPGGAGGEIWGSELDADSPDAGWQVGCACAICKGGRGAWQTSRAGA
jgi:hypothetical protein